MTENTYTTLTFYHFNGFFGRYIALTIMGLSKFLPPKGKGMLVGRLLGTGSGIGFSRKPNWGQYAHFAIWENQEKATEYFQKSRLIHRLSKWSNRTTIFEMRPYLSKGTWGGKNPYPHLPVKVESEGTVAVLTTAKLNPKKIADFWKFTDPINSSLVDAKGRLFSAGLGEWPSSQPMTFSVWENIEDAKNFAYKQPHHSAAVKGAREGGWFKEDLFVRFTVLRFEQ